MLSDGDKKSNDIFDTCIKAGISVPTMTYVKKQLGIKSIRKIDDWYWTLNPDSEDFESDDYNTFEQTNEIDETPVVFLDDDSIMEPPFGELELIDWGACTK